MLSKRLHMFRTKSFKWNHFHLKQNCEKAISPYFSKVSLLINRMINARSEKVFDKYTKKVLKYSEGKPSLIQLVNESIKPKDS